MPVPIFQSKAAKLKYTFCPIDGAIIQVMMVNIRMPLTQVRLLLDDPRNKTFLIYTEFHFIFIFSGNLLFF